MEKITNEKMEKIAIYMDDDIREWTHGCYAPCSNEEFIKQYFLRLLYEQKEEAGEAFERLLADEFGVDINDYVTYEEEQNVIDEWF